jgi:hypothetical protein
MLGEGAEQGFFPRFTWAWLALFEFLGNSTLGHVAHGRFATLGLRQVFFGVRAGPGGGDVRADEKVHSGRRSRLSINTSCANNANRAAMMSRR